MKIFVYVFAATAIVLTAGCTAKLANRQLGPEETEWKEYIEPMYPGWKVPATLPPAISDRYSQNNLPAAAADDNTVLSDGADLNLKDSKNSSAGAEDMSLSAYSQNVKVRYEDYTVEKDDSLSVIAKKVYGNGRKYYRIYKANEDIIKNPNRIYPGMTLKIPRP